MPVAWTEEMVGNEVKPESELVGSNQKGQFSFQSQRKALPKNAQTTAQLHSSHRLVK